MLIWYRKAEVKSESTNFTWLYFEFPNSFVYFNSNILHSLHLLGMRWYFAIDLFSNVLFQTFDYICKHVPTKLLNSLC